MKLTTVDLHTSLFSEQEKIIDDFKNQINKKDELLNKINDILKNGYNFWNKKIIINKIMKLFK